MAMPWRDPGPKAYFSGRTATDAEAVDWRARLDADPEDMAARGAWIGWAMARRRVGQAPTADLRDQLVWLVRNRPGSQLSGLVAPLCGHEWGWTDVEPLSAAWLDAVRDHADDAEVLDHAASYFSFQDPDRTLALLERARDLEPGKSLREMRLAHHHLLQAQFPSGGNLRSAAAALAHAERAVELEGATGRGDGARVCRLQCALAADRWDLAEQYAREVTLWVENEPSWRPVGDAVYHSQRVLGHVALRRGDVAAARSHLLRCCSGGSSPVLGSFGPDFSLAQELLDRGERETVLEFLGQCRKIWTHNTSTVDRLEQEVRAGGPCRLSRH